MVFFFFSLNLKVPIVPLAHTLNPKHGGITGICTCWRAVWSFSALSTMTALQLYWHSTIKCDPQGQLAITVVYF